MVLDIASYYNALSTTHLDVIVHVFASI